MSALLRRLHPTQLIGIAFALVILLGAVLLWLPFATTAEGSGSFLAAAFTSTSAVCVTGLVVVDTPAYYTAFGEVVIMGLVQIGGFGIMTLTSLLTLIVARRLGLRTRLIAQAESGALQLGDVRRVLLGVLVLSAIFETLAATLLTLRFAISYDYSLGRAVYHGIFHSITSFNNAGFALYSDNLVPFATDAWILVTIGATIIAGGLGFLSGWSSAACPEGRTVGRSTRS